MSLTSYDELLKQVESLKTENSSLRQELHTNSSHLTKLENEASNMKDVLTHVQYDMEGDYEFHEGNIYCDENTAASLEANCHEDSHDGHDLTLGIDDDDDPTNWLAPDDDDDTISPEQELFSLMRQLDDERNCILREAEEESKQRKWFYDQLEVISSKIDNLPLTEQYNLQNDMTRRQLEYDAKQLTESLHQKLGTGDQIAVRQSSRVQRLRTIEVEMMELQKRRHQIQMAEMNNGNQTFQPKVKDIGVNTIICGEVFIPKPGVDNNSYTSDKRMITSSTGKYCVCIATQTTDVILQELPADGMEDGIPCTQSLSSIYHGAWPNVKEDDSSSVSMTNHHDLSSVMSFDSETSGRQPPPAIEFVEPLPPSSQQLGTRVEMVYSLLSMLGTHDKDDMSRTLLAMSSSPDSCIAMRQSGCLPLLIQLLHGSDKDSGLLGNTRGSKHARARASRALHNIVHSHPDDKRGRREARVLRLLEQIRAHCDQLRNDSTEEDEAGPQSQIDHQPGPAIAALMKLSFDEEHRHAICTLGGLQAIADLLQIDTQVYGNTTEQVNITMRRYACMSLTNLTFGDGTNKALLCSMTGAMAALVEQLNSANEDLCQVAASVIRNLSWRADLASKKILREVNAVRTLMYSSMKVKKEPTFKSILSALWNLSAHCTENKADICAVENALEFLVSILTYKSPSKTLAIIENGGGILRNVSSHIAVREDYRKVLRQQGCLQILLKHLRSPSLTIVSNSCGTLWNLSARCAEDQQALWEMGAVSMLRNLVHSKHKMISMGSSAALKNLLSARPNLKNIDFDRNSQSGRPTLHARKQRALESELDPNLSETCDNVDSPRDSPNIQSKENDNQRFNESDSPRRPLIRGVLCRRGSSEGVNGLDNRLRSPQRVARSGSQDSVGSTHSDISHDRSRVNNMLAKSSRLLYERQGGSLERKHENGLHRVSSDGNCDSTRYPKNRIVQAMQEVAMHVGINPGANDMKDPPRNMRALLLQNAQTKAVQNQPRNMENYICPSHLNNNSNNDVTDEPINYSLKYQAGGNKDPHSFPLNNRPQPKVNNFIPPPGPGVRPAVFMVHNRFPEPANARHVPSLFNPQARHPAPHDMQTGFGSYAETDLDSVDQPTNFSLRYPEQTDEEYPEQPINYSVRYQAPDPQCADCKLEEARYLNDQMEEDMTTMHDDQMKTFYTEGTPYLSTATSLTDLVNAGVDKTETGENETDYREEPQDEIQNYSTKYSDVKERTNHDNYQDVNHLMKNDVANHYDQPRNFAVEETEQMQSYAPRDNTGAMDQTKTYNEEGTPVCFSRVSSMSSLHSSDARDHPDHRANVLQSIEENEKSDGMTSSVIEKSNIKSPENRDILHEGRSGVLKANGSFNSEKEHKTVTFDDNHHVEETPLMFSRCSSLGSLSSFDAQSVHSSVVSDYSRRASEVVSPSELPDSPSETMPPSPKRQRSPGPHVNADDNGFDRDTPKEFTDVAASQAQLIKPLKNLLSQLKSDSSTSTTVESPTLFADEGPPPGFSDTNSILSALTIDDGENANIITRQDIKSFADEICENNEEDDDDGDDVELQTMPNEDDNNSSMSEVSEGEEDILAQCISSAMPLPNNSSRKMRKSSSDNALKKKNGLSKIDNLGTNKSKLPTKSVNFTNNSLKSDKTNSKNKIQEEHNRSVQNPISESVLRNTYLANYDIGNDTAKSYATEGTPLNFSSANSLTDLTNVGLAEDISATEPEPIQNPQDESKSDNSSLCEENEDMLLSEVIQAAMPKSKAARKLNLEGADQNKVPAMRVPPKVVKKPNVPNVFKPLRTSSHISNPCPMEVGDVMKTYAEEGTPINFSTATSLSDLTMESADGGINGNSYMNESWKNSTGPSIAQTGDSVFYANDPDCPKVYHVEDTPETFSCNDSLSSLSVTDDDILSNDKLIMESRTRFSPKQKNQTSLQQNHHRQERESNIDQAKKFEVENTPTCFSISSSLSSLSTTDHIPQHNQIQSLISGHTQYNVEDTPAAFSSNSSLSNLSIESTNNYDPTPSEQALLDECISSAMPKNKGKEQPKRHTPTKSKIATRTIGKTTNGLKENKREKSMSYSCSDASESSPKSQAYQNWRKEPARSCDEASPPSPSSNRFGWNRSQSQDGSSFGKNLASAQSPRTNNRRPFLSTPETVRKNPLYVKDNKLLEEAREQNIKFPNQGSSLSDSISSNEKVDSEKSISEETVLVEKSVASRNDTTSFDDLMKTSFPKDLAPDTDDDILDAEDLEDEFSTLDSESDRTVASIATARNNYDYQDDSCLGSKECSFEEEITPEDERLLEANASLVVSELASNPQMTASSQDEDLFIENETLSLVSNDYTSDTASEISTSWSLNSEKISDNSNKDENKNGIMNGPRILKPGDKKQLEVPKENEKSIRGKRKPLYTRSASTPPKVGNLKPTVAKISPNKNQPISKVNSSQTRRQPLKQTPPVNGTRAPSKPTYTRSSSLTRTPPSNNLSTKSPVRSSSGNIGKPPIAKDSNIKKVTTQERPKPIVKQNTFIKDSSSHKNTPTISTETDEPQPNAPRLLEKRNSTDGISSHRNSVGSMSSRHSAEFIPSVDPPKKPVTASPGTKKTSNIARPIASNVKSPVGSKNSLNKSGSGTNLRKTSSGSSLTKTNSGTSLNKGGSNTNLKKMANGSNSNLKKSDSNASIKTNSRPGTPNGRRLSSGSSTTPNKNPSTPNSDSKKPPIGSVGKKQVPSKIASLWKKDETEGSPTRESPSRLPTANKPAKPVTPKRTSSLQSSSKGKTVVAKSPSQTFTNDEPLEGISKSSTYDKITSVNCQAEQTSSQDENCDLGNTTVNSVFNLTDNSSVNNSNDSLDECSLVNTGTYKRKKGSSNHSLQLPNADETCRPESVGSISDSINDDNSLSGTLRSDKLSVSSDLDSVGKSSDKSKSSKSKDKTKKESKSVAQSIKSTLFGKKPGFGKIFKSKNPKKESEKTLSAKPLHQESRTSPSAIVPPFNYSPPVNSPHTPKISDIQNTTDTNNENNPNKKSSLPTPTKHATKTEMLLARRRSYLNSKNDVNSDDDGKMPCMVTTV